MLEEKQRDGLGSSSDGFYESKREWLGRRHYVLAFERYLLDLTAPICLYSGVCLLFVNCIVFIM